MRRPRVVIELDDGTGTYVSYVPINHPSVDEAIEAAAVAAARLVASFERERVLLHERLRSAFDGSAAAS